MSKPQYANELQLSNGEVEEEEEEEKGREKEEEEEGRKRERGGVKRVKITIDD